MIRAFAAIALPEAVIEALERVQADLPVSRLVPPENLHLTLVFLGALDEPALEDVHLAFSRVHGAAFDLTLDGLGLFGGRKPRLVHAGVAESAPLRHLQAKLEQAARQAGVEVEHRRFTPHVTLARLNQARVDRDRLERAIAAATAFRAGPFPVRGFGLFRSDLGRSGAAYSELAHYPLSSSTNPASAP
jgi:2'-5' RNA ligase